MQNRLAANANHWVKNKVHLKGPTKSSKTQQMKNALAQHAKPIVVRTGLDDKQNRTHDSKIAP